MKDKREVILEFHSSPDAILNALHQAGWQIIPKKDPDQSVWDYLDGKPQPQRSEQQEWTPQEILSWLRKSKPELVAEIERLNAALSAERQRCEGDAQALDGLGKLNDELHQQLLSAQAAIKDINKLAMEYVRADLALRAIREKSHDVDLSLLHRHDAEVRKPLVEALVALRDGEFETPDGNAYTGCSPETERVIIGICADALAKVKENL